MTKRIAIESNIMTLAEVADYLRVHKSTIYRLLKRPDSKFPRFKLGSDYRFNRETIDEWRLAATLKA